jgi:RHS repeat-associated protein
MTLPFGDSLTCTGPDATEHDFTGKEHDVESGDDYFLARYYGSTMGRMLSPDWSEAPAPLPYADLANPQSLNLYAYVGDNPLSFFDITGHHQERSDQTSTFQATKLK